LHLSEHLLDIMIVLSEKSKAVVNKDLRFPKEDFKMRRNDANERLRRALESQDESTNESTDESDDSSDESSYDIQADIEAERDAEMEAQQLRRRLRQLEDDLADAERHFEAGDEWERETITRLNAEQRTILRRLRELGQQVPYEIESDAESRLARLSWAVCLHSCFHGNWN